MRSATICHLLGVLILAGASTARADISEADLAAMGGDEYSKRHAVTRKLVADDTLTADQVAAVFHKAQNVEQKHRLLALARHHFLRALRERDFPTPKPGQPSGPGALGLTHGAVTADDLPQLKQAGVRVRRTLPGFPAHAALEDGDLILAIDGVPIPAGYSVDQITRHFGDSIQMIQAGHATTLTVHRDGKDVKVSVRLAQHSALSGMYQPELRSNYEEAWVKFRDEKVIKAKGQQK